MGAPPGSVAFWVGTRYSVTAPVLVIRPIWLWDSAIESSYSLRAQMTLTPAASAAALSVRFGGSQRKFRPHCKLKVSSVIRCEPMRLRTRRQSQHIHRRLGTGVDSEEL